MLDLSLHQGTSLHCHTPEIELRLSAVVSQGSSGRSLETLWQVCSHLHRLGYPVVVLDGTAAESYAAPGLQHLLTSAPHDNASASLAIGAANTSSLAVIPAFQGLYTLAFNSPHVTQPLQALQPLFRQYALIVVYASVATLSTPLLKGTATAPLLLIGMVSFVPGVPAAIDQPVGALPSLIYIWENASERAFHERTAAAIIVLLVFMLLMNAAAIILRRRFERRW